MTRDGHIEVGDRVWLRDDVLLRELVGYRPDGTEKSRDIRELQCSYLYVQAVSAMGPYVAIDCAGVRYPGVHLSLLQTTAPAGPRP